MFCFPVFIYNPAWVKYSLLHILHLWYLVVGIALYNSEGVADGETCGGQSSPAELESDSEASQGRDMDVDEMDEVC